MSKPKEMTPERLALFRKRLVDYEDDPNPNPADAVIRDLLAHVDALTARLETAERELAKVESVHQSACRKLHGQAAGWKLCEDERNAQKARADAVQKKLGALAEAAEGVLKYCETGDHLGAWGTLVDALRVARGEP
jgi:hypothetical protein